jgi:hypothetical protein
MYVCVCVCVLGVGRGQVSRGAVQALQSSASTFAGMVGTFCGRLHWWQFEVSACIHPNGYACVRTYSSLNQLFAPIICRSMHAETSPVLMCMHAYRHCVTHLWSGWKAARSLTSFLSPGMTTSCYQQFRNSTIFKYLSRCVSYMRV